MHLKRAVLVAAALAFLFVTLLAPAAASAFMAPPVPAYVGQALPPASKIPAGLYDAFRTDEYVTYLVMFNEQADTQQALRDALARTNVTALKPSEMKLVARSSVVNALRSTADRVRLVIRPLLDRYVAAGDIKSYRPYFIVNGMAVTSTRAIMEQLAALPQVKLIATDDKVELLDTTPTGTSGGDPSEVVGWNIEAVGAPAAWSKGLDGSGVVIASIDTGVDWGHPALRNQWRGLDPMTGEPGPLTKYSWFDAFYSAEQPEDLSGHGTHTMGTMVGAEPNEVNRIGVAPGARWISARAFSQWGGSDSDILAAAEWLLAPGGDPAMAPDIISNSWGSKTAGTDEFFRPMVQAWRAAGIVPVFASGNLGAYRGSVVAPGNYPESITVGAVDSNGALANFSGCGPAPYPGWAGSQKPDLVAPGVDVRSSVPGNSYSLMNGTSMATPHVAGAAALLLQADPSLTVDQIEQILTDTAQPIEDTTWTGNPNLGYGYGLLDIEAALQQLTASSGTLLGKVIVGTADRLPPEVRYAPITLAYQGAGVPITALVQDNTMVTNVDVFARLPGGGSFARFACRLVAGNYLNGEYRGTLPANLLDPSKGIEYYISATDNCGNTSNTTTYSLRVSSGITPGYRQDFEVEPIGWTHAPLTQAFSSDPWRWGIPSSGPGTAHSGGRVYGIQTNQGSVGRFQAALSAPPIDLTVTTAARLSFWYRYNQRNGSIPAVVAISRDGSPFSVVKQYTESTDGWEQDSVDLTPYAGSKAKVIFVLTYDGGGDCPTWLLDDVEVLDPGRVTPVTTGIHPVVITPSFPRTDRLVSGPKAFPGDPGLSNLNPSDRFSIPADWFEADKPKPAVPTYADISIVETNAHARVHLPGGEFRLWQSPGVYTVKAEAYGYYPVQIPVRFSAGADTSVTFTLRPRTLGTITGTVRDKVTGVPVTNAVLSLVEDAHVPATAASADGTYEIAGLPGNYTMLISSPDYLPLEVPVTITEGASGNVDPQLKPFVGLPVGLYYDDATPSASASMYKASDRIGVAYSAEKPGAKLQTVSFLFSSFRGWDGSYPAETSFHWAVYAMKEDGPGDILAGPFGANAICDSQTWTSIDVSDLDLRLDGDFVIAEIQDFNYHAGAPYICVDGDTPASGKTWSYTTGEWHPLIQGWHDNAMIRATVLYPIEAPVITAPVAGTISSLQRVNVTGTTAPNTTVNVYRDGVKVGDTISDSAGGFSFPVSVSAGRHTIAVNAEREGRQTDKASVSIMVLGITPPIDIRPPLPPLIPR